MRRSLGGPAALRPSGARLLAISMLALTGAVAAPAQSAPAVPLTVYGQLPSIEDVAVSPDGSRVAYVRTQGDLRVVFVATVADHKVIRWVRTGEEKLRDINWADDDNLMILTSETTSVYGFKDEWRLLRVYNIGANMDVSDPAGFKPLARRSIRGVARRAAGGGYQVHAAARDVLVW
jgi:hypothetical protein